MSHGGKAVERQKFSKRKKENGERRQIDKDGQRKGKGKMEKRKLEA